MALLRGFLKTANTGQYLIPDGPGTGNAVIASSAAYGNWSPLAFNFTMTAPAAPTETQFSSASTTHNVTMPGTVAAGDLLICIIAFDGNPTLGTTPTGWTYLNAQNNGSTVKMAVYYKVADGTEDGTTVNFPTSSSEQAAAQVYRILSGQYSGVPYGFAGATGGDPDSFTPTSARRFSVFVAQASDGDANAPTGSPTNYSTIDTLVSGAGANGVGMGSAYRLDFNQSTIENPDTFTFSGTGVAITFALDHNAVASEALYLTGISIDASGETALQVQLGTGTQGAESAIGTYLVTPKSGSSAYGDIVFPAVIPVAAGARLSCRIAGLAATQYVTIHALNQDDVA